MDHRVTEFQNLLNENGMIAEEGWASFPVWNYERNKIHASGWRIKEWDYYAINDTASGWTLCATISDLGFAALYSVSFIDYNLAKFAQKDLMKFFTFGKTGLSPNSTGDSTVSVSGKDLSIAFSRRGSERHIVVSVPGLVLPDGRKGLSADVTLSQPNDLESLNIATSWKENRKAFYLNQKVNCMKASGSVCFGNDSVSLELGKVWGVLDWGRGRWTRENTWYWGSASGTVGSHSFGFNLGYGFSDRTPASENALFYDGKLHKLSEIEFHIPSDSFVKPWTITSSDNRLNLDFVPVVDRYSNTDFKIIKSLQHQVFGHFSGTAILDDGTVLEIKNLSGFAEKVYNKW